LDAAAAADAAHRGARGDAEARAATLLAAKLGFMLADSADEGAIGIEGGFKRKGGGIRIITFRVTTRLQSKSNF
jgi:hypothetical protein